jgi:imidazolonepropionase-like amidohydrolase
MKGLQLALLGLGLLTLTLSAQNQPPSSEPSPKFYRPSDVPHTERADSLAIVGATLVDGRGGPPTPNTTILVRGGRIVKVGTVGDVEIPPDAVLIRADGQTVLPGLIDMHVHLNKGTDLHLFIGAGVTSVRDVGNLTDQVTALARGTGTNEIVGPRVFYSGESFASRGGFSPFQRPTKDVSEARAEVRKRIASGASVIKIVNDITPDLVEAIVDEAHRAGLPVTADILGNRLVNANVAIALGVDGLEHVSGVPQAVATEHSPADFPEAINIKALFGWLYADSLKEARLIDTIVTRGTYIVPTLAVLEVRSPIPRPTDPGSEFMSENLKGLWSAIGRSGRSNATVDAAFLTHFIYSRQFVGKLNGAGGRIAAGTDTPTPGLVPGFSLHRELELLVQAGLTPSEAIQAATSTAARFLGKDRDLGTVEPGKLADMVIISGAPHRQISDIRKIRTVVKDSWIFDAADVARLSTPH